MYSETIFKLKVIIYYYLKHLKSDVEYKILQFQMKTQENNSIISGLAVDKDNQ